MDAHLNVAFVVGGDVADDRETEPRATGVAAAGPIDAVEALEDPVEVLGGDADAAVVHARAPTSSAVDGADTNTLAPAFAVLDRVVDQIADRRDELASIAEHGERRVGLVEVDPDVALLGARRASGSTALAQRRRARCTGSRTARPPSSIRD